MIPRDKDTSASIVMTILSRRAYEIKGLVYECKIIKNTVESNNISITNTNISKKD